MITHAFKYFGQKLQTITYGISIIIGLLTLWSILLYLEVFMPQYTQQVSTFSAQAEFIPHILLLIPTYIIYKNADKTNRKILFWLSVLSFGLFLNHLVFYILVYLRGSLITNNHFLVFILDFIPHLSWIVAGLIFLSRILYGILPTRNLTKLLGCFLFVNIIIIGLFLSSIHYAFILSSWQSISQVILECTQLLIFDCIILCLIYSEKLGFSYFLAGLTTLVSGNMLIVYSVASQTSNLLTCGRLLWFLGLVLMTIGLWTIKNSNDYIVSNWFSKTNKIKNMFALWSFGTFVTGFILFFMIAYTSSNLNDKVFISLPIFIMLYSIIAVLFSILMGKTFEAPFKQLAGNIKALMLDDKKSKINDQFSTEEFVFLQDFIFEAFKRKEEARILELEKEAFQAIAMEQDKFKRIVKQVMHDVTSPISSIENIISKLGGNVLEDDRVTLRNAADRIAGISQKLLRNYNDENLESENENFLVSLALLQIINEKREEYFDRNIIFDVDIDEEVKFICIKQNIGMFKRMISNLVNNSVEALNNKPDGKIAIILGENVNELVIIVEDNGSGMPQHIQDKFKQGIGITEGKENGHGVGLTQVRDAIATGNGTYRIAANNKGTTITIWFPQVATPSWLATEIKLLLEDTVIILDDDESIHGSWDKSFANILEKYPTLKILHFTYGHEVVAYINNLTTEQKQNIFLLTDFELLEQGLNGLDVVKQTNMRRAILVTSYSSNPERQMEVSKLGIKMLPKELAASAKISVDKRIPKWSSTVDMVWVEDQIWLLDDLVKRHYNHLKVDKYYDPISFMEDVHQYPLDTRIILDTYYISPDGVQYDATGYDLARELHTKGYTKLIIFTGEGIKDHALEYLTVARKASSYDTENLDKL